MKILLRGHIRDAFDTPALYDFIHRLHSLYSVELYVQTWGVFSNNISWRPIQANSKRVTEPIIRQYFRDIPVAQILILNAANVEGRKTGNIALTRAPLIGWKNMWYGKFHNIKSAREEFGDVDENLLNMRFDLFSNSNVFHTEDILAMIDKNHAKTFDGIVFTYDTECKGIDNIYMGRPGAMYRLIEHFNANLDVILARPEYANIDSQERIVFRENQRLFNPAYIIQPPKESKATIVNRITSVRR